MLIDSNWIIFRKFPTILIPEIWSKKLRLPHFILFYYYEETHLNNVSFYTDKLPFSWVSDGNGMPSHLTFAFQLQKRACERSQNNRLVWIFLEYRVVNKFNAIFFLHFIPNNTISNSFFSLCDHCSLRSFAVDCSIFIFWGPYQIPIFFLISLLLSNLGFLTVPPLSKGIVLFSYCISWIYHTGMWNTDDASRRRYFPHRSPSLPWLGLPRPVDLLLIYSLFQFAFSFPAFKGYSFPRCGVTVPDMGASRAHRCRHRPPPNCCPGWRIMSWCAPWQLCRRGPTTCLGMPCGVNWRPGHYHK